MNQSTMQRIIENYINGNISDFKKSIQRISKKDMLELIQEAKDSYGLEIEGFMSFLLKIL